VPRHIANIKPFEEAPNPTVAGCKLRDVEATCNRFCTFLKQRSGDGDSAVTEGVNSQISLVYDGVKFWPFAHPAVVAPHRACVVRHFPVHGRVRRNLLRIALGNWDGELLQNHRPRTIGDLKMNDLLFVADRNVLADLAPPATGGHGGRPWAVTRIPIVVAP